MMTTPKRRQGLDNAALFVSLYIVLLAFFILLNTLSKIDAEKMESAVQSVNRTFSLIQPVKELPQLQESVGSDPVIPAYFEEVKSTAATLIPLEKMETATKGNVMYLRIPQAEVFKAGLSELRHSTPTLTDAIARTTLQKQDSLRVQMELELDTPDFSGVTTALSEKRMGLLTRGFIAQGIAPTSLTPALTESDKDTVTFIFIAYETPATTMEINR